MSLKAKVRKFEKPDETLVINSDVVGTVPDHVLDEAIRMAYDIVATQRAMSLLKQNNDAVRKQLQELLETYSIPHINVRLSVGPNEPPEEHNIKVISTRGFIPVISGIKKMASIKLKKLFPKWEVAERKRVAKEVAEAIGPFLRNDAITVTEVRKQPWGAKLEEDKVTTAYLYVTDGLIPYTEPTKK